METGDVDPSFQSMLDNNISRLFVALSRHSGGGERAKKMTKKLLSFFPSCFFWCLLRTI